MRMNRDKILALRTLAKVLFSVIFLTMFIKNIVQVDSNYIKFSMISFINEHNLGKTFYLFVFLQLFLSLGIYFTHINPVRILFEILFLLNITFLIAYIVYANYIFPGCVSCNYSINYYNESYKLTLAITVFSIFLYFLSISKIKKVASLPASSHEPKQSR